MVFNLEKKDKLIFDIENSCIVDDIRALGTRLMICKNKGNRMDLQDKYFPSDISEH